MKETQAKRLMYRISRTHRSSFCQVNGQTQRQLQEMTTPTSLQLDDSQLFQATVHGARVDESVKMKNLKTMVTGKAKEAVAGLVYTAGLYNVAWNVLVRNFVTPQMVVYAQLKQIYSFPPMKPYDSAALIMFAKKVSSCVNIFTHFNYVGDLNYEGAAPQGS